MTIMTVAA